MCLFGFSGDTRKCQDWFSIFIDRSGKKKSGTTLILSRRAARKSHTFSGSACFHFYRRSAPGHFVPARKLFMNQVARRPQRARQWVNSV
jgi:hypothetical protein